MEIVIVMVIMAIIKSVMDSNKAKAESKAKMAGNQEPQVVLAEPVKNLQDVIEQVNKKIKKTAADMQRPVSSEPAKVKPNSEQQKKQAKQKEKMKEKQRASRREAARQADDPKRLAHKQLRASVKPITTTVTPIKNAFENAEQDDHRITLNPNIRYHHSEKGEQVVAIKVEPDRNSVIQGIIWSEILSKPKALRR